MFVLVAGRHGLKECLDELVTKGEGDGSSLVYVAWYGMVPYHTTIGGFECLMRQLNRPSIILFYIMRTIRGSEVHTRK